MRRGLATPLKSRTGYTLEQFYSQARIAGETETSIQKFSRKANLYGKLGPEFIAAEISNRINVDVKKLLEETAATVIKKGEAEAIKTLKQALRYISAPLLYISLSKIYAMRDNYESAFKSISKALTHSQDNLSQREYAYRELASLYEKQEFDSQKKHILRELN